MRSFAACVVLFALGCGRDGFDVDPRARLTDDGPSDAADSADDSSGGDADAGDGETVALLPDFIALGAAARDRNGTLPRISLGTDGSLGLAYRSQGATQVEVWQDGAWVDLGTPYAGEADDVDITHGADGVYVLTHRATSNLQRWQNSGWSEIALPAVDVGDTTGSYGFAHGACRLAFSTPGILYVMRGYDAVVSSGSAPNGIRQRAVAEVLRVDATGDGVVQDNNTVLSGEASDNDYLHHGQMTLVAHPASSMVTGRSFDDITSFRRSNQDNSAWLLQSVGDKGFISGFAATVMPDGSVVVARATEQGLFVEQSVTLDDDDGLASTDWDTLPAPTSEVVVDVALARSGALPVIAYTLGSDALVYTSYYDGADWQSFAALGDDHLVGSSGAISSAVQIVASDDRVCVAWEQTVADTIQVRCWSL